MRGNLLVTVGLGVLAAGCGSPSGRGDGGAGPADGPTGVVPGEGMFVWTVNGTRTFTAVNDVIGAGLNTVSYNATAATDGLSFSINIQGLVMPTGELCSLVGKFADTVPPPAGTYSIGTFAAQTDAWFFATCVDGAGAGGAVAGRVVLTKSVVGDIEGTFNTQGVGTPATTIVGGFNVACIKEGSCGPFSVAAGGTCAELLACCGQDPACAQLHGAAMANGDTACGRTLTAYRSRFCPP